MSVLRWWRSAWNRAHGPALLLPPSFPTFGPHWWDLWPLREQSEWSLPASRAHWSWRRARDACTPSSDRCCYNLQQSGETASLELHAALFTRAVGPPALRRTRQLNPAKVTHHIQNPESRRITEYASCNALGGDTCEGVDPEHRHKCSLERPRRCTRSHVRLLWIHQRGIGTWLGIGYTGPRYRSWGFWPPPRSSVAESPTFHWHLRGFSHARRLTSDFILIWFFLQIHKTLSDWHMGGLQ